MVSPGHPVIVVEGATLRSPMNPIARSLRINSSALDAITKVMRARNFRYPRLWSLPDYRAKAETTMEMEALCLSKP